MITLKRTGVRTLPVRDTVFAAWSSTSQWLAFLWPDPDPTVDVIHRHTLWLMHGPELHETVHMETSDTLTSPAAWALLKAAGHVRSMSVARARTLLSDSITAKTITPPV